MTEAGPPLLRPLLFLTGAALVLGLLAQTVSPTRIPWRGDWSHYVETKALQAGLTLADLNDVQGMVNGQSHLVLDARPVADYDRGHLPGALSLPQTDLDTYYAQIMPLLTPEQPVLVYCSGLECDESFLLSVYLREQGFTNVALFAGGWAAWRDAGLPVEGP
jgi:rhodanese-related sulfurtransferase